MANKITERLYKKILEVYPHSEDADARMERFLLKNVLSCKNIDQSKLSKDEKNCISSEKTRIVLRRVYFCMNVGGHSDDVIRSVTEEAANDMAVTPNALRSYYKEYPRLLFPFGYIEWICNKDYDFELYGKNKYEGSVSTTTVRKVLLLIEVIGGARFKQARHGHKNGHDVDFTQKFFEVLNAWIKNVKDFEEVEVPGTAKEVKAARLRV